jgi:hypothetical protein
VTGATASADEGDIRALLVKGGMGSLGPDDGSGDVFERRYDALRDPVGAELLAALLAERAGRHEPTLVVVWDDVVSVVLGYAVAARLRVPVVRIYDHEGLIGFVGGTLEGAVAVVVADRFRDERVWRASRTLLEQHGGRLAAAVSLVDDRPAGEDSVAHDCLLALPATDGGGR